MIRPMPVHLADNRASKIRALQASAAQHMDTASRYLANATEKYRAGQVTTLSMGLVQARAELDAAAEDYAKISVLTTSMAGVGNYY